MDSTQLLNWLLPVTGTLIAALWVHLLRDVGWLRDKLESLEKRIHEKADQDALRQLADRQSEKEEKFQRDIKDCYRDLLRSSVPREPYSAVLPQGSVDAAQFQQVVLPRIASPVPTTDHRSNGETIKAIREKFPEIHETNKIDSPTR